MKQKQNKEYPSGWRLPDGSVVGDNSLNDLEKKMRDYKDLSAKYKYAVSNIKAEIRKRTVWA